MVKLFGLELKRASSDKILINEAVHLDKKAIFIAIPKTGSTSIRNQLRQEGKPIVGNPHLNIVQIRDLIYTYVLKNALGKNNQFPNKNVPSDSDLRQEAKDMFNTCFKFSAVRNPWARAVSLYHRREGVPRKNVQTFEEFCEHHFHASDTCRQPTLHKNQCDWHVDEKGNNLMDFVYKVEDLNTAIREIKKRTEGRVKLTYATENKNPNSPSLAYQSLYTDKSKKIIAQRFEKDIDLFKYTF